MRRPRFARPTLPMAMALLLAGCASQEPAMEPGATGDAAKAQLACSLPTNCVNSLGTGRLPPLRFEGTPAQGLAALKATLASFPQAQITHSEDLLVQTIFTTPAGFRDAVDFRIDPAAQQIDFRSHSLFGLFDFGKNRSRMLEFAARFQRQAASTSG